jgi:hypothetical protein
MNFFFNRLGKVFSNVLRGPRLAHLCFPMKTANGVDRPEQLSQLCDRMPGRGFPRGEGVSWPQSKGFS